MQGMCQGNGASPAARVVTSIAIIQSHKQMVHSVKLICPITRTSLHLVGTLFEDDTDIEHFDMWKVKTAHQAHEVLQGSIINWGKLLVATGGVSIPAKCFYHMISFKWNADRNWMYDCNENLPNLSILVPLSL